MYLVIIGWMYVAVMMAVAEATNTTGTVLGALFTFLLYGLAPCALAIYLMGTPARRRAIKKREMEERAAAATAAAAPAESVAPDESSESSAHPVTPVRKEP